MDRQRRKQAEFLVYRHCEWQLIQEIGVYNASMQSSVETILAEFSPALRVPVRIHRAWYY